MHHVGLLKKTRFSPKDPIKPGGLGFFIEKKRFFFNTVSALCGGSGSICIMGTLGHWQHQPEQKCSHVTLPDSIVAHVSSVSLSFGGSVLLFWQIKECTLVKYVISCSIIILRFCRTRKVGPRGRTHLELVGKS